MTGYFSQSLKNEPYQFTKLSLDVNCLADLSTLEELLQNKKVAINELELSCAPELKPGYKLLVGKNIKPDEIFSNISGLEELSIAIPVDVNTLNRLLTTTALSTLKSLRISSDDIEDLKALEQSLGQYLNKNKDLELLFLEGNLSQDFSQSLKYDLVRHPNLTQFNVRCTLGENLAEDAVLQEKLFKKHTDAIAKWESSCQSSIESPHVFYRQTTDEALVNFQSLLNHCDRRHLEEPTKIRYKAWLDLLIKYYKISHLKDSYYGHAKGIPPIRSSKDDETYNSLVFYIRKLLTRIENASKNSSPDPKLVKDVDYAFKEAFKFMQPAPSNIIFPSSYKNVTEQGQSDLDEALRLLDDYTKGNSFVSRFSHGHWNRHHVEKVAAIVKYFRENDGGNINELLNALIHITLINPNGSLARRIKFIRAYCNSEQLDLTPEQPTP